MKNRKLIISILAGIMAAALLFGLAVMAIPTADAASLSALQQQLQDLKNEKKKIDANIDKLQDQLSENLEEMEDVVEQKNTIDQEIFMLHEKLNNINEQITTYGVLIGDKQEELDEAEAHLAELSAKNKERIRAMEEQGNLSYWSVLFKANSFIDLLDRLSMINEIAASDKRRMQEMSDAADAVAAAKAELEAEMDALEDTKAELTETQKELEVKSDEADALLAELIATGEEYEALLDEAEEEAGRLGTQIANTQNAYDDAQYKQWLSTSKPSSSSSSGSANDGSSSAPSSSGWIVPCSYTRFTSPYGYRIHPIYGYKKFHYGVDLAGPKGTPIKAAKSGTVVAASYGSSAGYYVQINHGDGFQSKYLHMTHYIVKSGQYVTQGQVIGYMGSTGASTGSHLHFGILYNGSYVNPARYIDI